MKVEHDLLCNECLSPAGTVAAAATQPRPTDRAGGLLPEFLLSRTESECATLLLSQQFTDLSPLLVFTPVLYSPLLIALAKQF